jgi:hypothetical protein
MHATGRVATRGFREERFHGCISHSLLLQHVTDRSGLQFQSTKASNEAETFAMRYTTDTLLPPPASKASSAEKIDFLHQQLDSMGVDAEILPGLLLLGGGNRERLQGGALQCPQESNVFLLVALLL